MDSEFRNAEDLVEKTIRKLGLDPASCRAAKVSGATSARGNAAGLANAAFGLVGDRVVVVSERPVVGLGGEEVEQIIRHLAAVADTFDGKFEKEFGATKA